MNRNMVRLKYNKKHNQNLQSISPIHRYPKKDLSLIFFHIQSDRNSFSSRRSSGNNTKCFPFLPLSFPPPKMIPSQHRDLQHCFIRGSVRFTLHNQANLLQIESADTEVFQQSASVSVAYYQGLIQFVTMILVFFIKFLDSWDFFIWHHKGV